MFELGFLKIRSSVTIPESQYVAAYKKLEKIKNEGILSKDTPPDDPTFEQQLLLHDLEKVKNIDELIVSLSNPRLQDVYIKDNARQADYIQIPALLKRITALKDVYTTPDIQDKAYSADRILSHSSSLLPEIYNIRNLVMKFLMQYVDVDSRIGFQKRQLQLLRNVYSKDVNHSQVLKMLKVLDNSGYLFKGQSIKSAIETIQKWSTGDTRNLNLDLIPNEGDLKGLRDTFTVNTSFKKENKRMPLNLRTNFNRVFTFARQTMM